MAKAKKVQESKVEEAKFVAKEQKVVEAKVEPKVEVKVVEAKVEVKEVAAQENGENEGEDNGKKHRYFKCMYGGASFGRYSGSKPKQAANKALTIIIKKNGGNTLCLNKKFKFDMVECTRNGKKKTSTYEGWREALEKPLPVKINSAKGEKSITYRFANKLKKLKDEKKKVVKEKKPVKKAKVVKAKKPVKKQVKKVTKKATTVKKGKGKAK